ncbi:MAG: prepilin-type N-terminal cleavage/methylation domain-containing protein [Patescibacteria group bacterium]|jgi:hypothetical protein
MFLSAKQNNSGFTLVEALVTVVIFVVIAISIQQIFIASTQTIRLSRLMIASASLANEQFEIIHNLPYSDVGLLTGIPVGKLTAKKTITRDQTDFFIETTVRNIDDPFDGLIDGMPNDTSPADYKLVELKISVLNSERFKPMVYAETIAPKNLENSSTNGALFIRVFNASGQPISDAGVHIENNSTSPATLIDDVSDKDGYLRIIDVPPSFASYKISVSKSGYSQDQTRLPGDPANPNPVKPHATVIAQTATQISFSIDEVCSLNIQTVTETCSPIADVDFVLKGEKIIGSEPDVLKYDQNFFTSASGDIIINDLEWDTYNLTMNDDDYNLSGTNSIIPINLLPGGSQEVKLIVASKNPRSLLVGVKQGGTNLPLSGATVKLEEASSSEELITGRGFLRQLDWSGGSGQENYLDQTKYYSSNGDVETNNPAGEIKLRDIFGFYADSGELESSSFDTGSVSNFYQLYFYPQDQAPETGTDNIRLQIATNNDNSSWNFKGPDGTDGTYYTKNDLNINSEHNGDRYLRYKLYLQTASSTFTPNISEVNFTFSSLCVPSGQVIFTGLASSSYTLTISKDSFQTSIENIDISLPWQQHETILMPE